MAIKNISKGHVFDENFLMAVATVGAYGTGEFGEAAAVITCPAHYFYSRMNTKSKGENKETETWF